MIVLRERLLGLTRGRRLVKGKACAYCQKPFHEIHWHVRQPALLGPDRNTAQWSEIPPENLPAVFQNLLQVCWNCFIAENHRRQHPERLVDRGWELALGATQVKLPKPHQLWVTR